MRADESNISGKLAHYFPESERTAAIVTYIVVRASTIFVAK